MYFNKCNSAISKVLAETRNLSDIEVQRALLVAFPFHKSNVVAYREYGKEITRLTGRTLWPTGPTPEKKAAIAAKDNLTYNNNHELYS